MSLLGLYQSRLGAIAYEFDNIKMSSSYIHTFIFKFLESALNPYEIKAYSTSKLKLDDPPIPNK